MPWVVGGGCTSLDRIGCSDSACCIACHAAAPRHTNLASVTACHQHQLSVRVRIKWDAVLLCKSACNLW